MTGTLRTISTPGVSSGTMTIECRPCVAGLSAAPVAASSGATFTAITMAKRQWGCRAPVVNHLRPLITQFSPSRRMLVQMLVASDEATSGSDIEKHERISPSSSGRSQRCFCSGVPKRCSSSMLPVSGALQLKTSEAQGMRPMISAIGAYSRLLMRVPGSSAASAGRNRFHKPSSRARCFSGSTTSVG